MKNMKTFTLLLALFCAGFAYADSLKIDKTEALPGEEIHVTIVTSGALPPSSWIGVIPSSIPHKDESTNDANDVDYQYTNESKTYTFKAPLKPGEWDFRLSGGGKDLATVSFTVKAPDYQ